MANPSEKQRQPREPEKDVASGGTAADHLSRISTIWTRVFQAHGEEQESVKAAQRQIMQQYSAVIYRYLLRVLRSRDAADEVFQEFALRFVQGGFRHATPQRGRFRDYLKVSVLRLVSKYRRERRQTVVCARDVRDDHGEEAAAHDEREFLASCREELLQRAWKKLEQIEKQTGQPFYRVLQFRARNPKASSAKMAEAVSCTLDRAFTPAGVRKVLQRARERYADLLLDLIAEGVGDASPAVLEQELIDLGLQSYCHSAWRRRFRPDDGK